MTAPAWRWLLPPTFSAAIVVTATHFIGAYAHGGQLVGLATRNPWYLFGESLAGFAVGTFWLLPLAVASTMAPPGGAPQPQVTPRDLILPAIIASPFALASSLVPLLPLGFRAHGVVTLVSVVVLFALGMWVFRSRIKLPMLWDVIAKLRDNQDQLKQDRETTLATLSARLRANTIRDNETLMLLLYGLFDKPELLMLLRAIDSDGSLARSLPQETAAISPLEHSLYASEVLRRHGLVNERLFAELRKQKPEHEALISEVEERAAAHEAPPIR